MLKNERIYVIMKKILFFIILFPAAVFSQEPKNSYEIILKNGKKYDVTFIKTDYINGQHILCLIDSTGNEIKINRSDIKYQKELRQKSFIKDETISNKQNLQIKILISPGFSYSHFSSIDSWLGLRDFIGIHFAAEAQIEKRNRKSSDYYFTFGTDIYFCPTKVGFEYEEEVHGNLDLNPFSINRNSKATYKSIVFFPTIGFEFFEISIGLGKVWYKIEKYVNGELSQSFKQGLTAENQDLAISHSEKLASLTSEAVWAYRFRFPIKKFLDGKIRMWLVMQGMEGRKYHSHKSGWYVSSWGEPGTKDRMVAFCLGCQVRYQIN
jgi:hypothetical protein